MKSVVAPLVALCALSACGSEVVVHGASEREANQILELLADHDLAATKAADTSGRQVVFDIAVASGQRLAAVKLLNRHELPRRPDHGYREIYAEPGLIPTASEERGRHLAALEGELERQLKLLDGVLDVQVQLVLPESGPLARGGGEAPASAGVTLKYLPRGRAGPPLAEDEVRAVVAAGVERLRPEAVVVLMRPAGPLEPAPDDESAAPPPAARPGSPVPVVLTLAVLGLLAAGVLASRRQLAGVRARLARLQEALARDRRRPTAGAPVTPGVTPS